MKTDQDLEAIFAEGNRLSRVAALRAVYDAGVADQSKPEQRAETQAEPDPKPKAKKPK